MFLVFSYRNTVQEKDLGHRDIVHKNFIYMLQDAFSAGFINIFAYWGDIIIAIGGLIRLRNESVQQQLVGLSDIRCEGE